MRTPEHAMCRFYPSSKLAMRVDLHYKGGSSDKVYILTVEEAWPTKFDVLAHYGKRGAMNLQATHYGSFPTYQQAKAKLRDQQHAKERKGYKLIHEEEHYTNGALTMAQKAQVMHASIITPSTKKTHEFLGKLKDMDFDTLSAKAMEGFLKKDTFIVQHYPSMRHHYVILQDYEWIFYHIEDIPMGQVTDFMKREPYESGYTRPPQPVISLYQGMCWFGVMDDNDKFWITDVVYVPNVKDVHKMPWKARRQLMGTIAYDLFPGVDPYDTSYNMPFLDYHYDDKLEVFQNGSGIFVARGIEHPLLAKFFVHVKP